MADMPEQSMRLGSIVDLDRYTIEDVAFQQTCRHTLDEEGVLVMPGFLRPEAVESVRCEGEAKQSQAYFCTQSHNAYLTPPDPAYPEDHPRNREVISSKGCITDDQVGEESTLRVLYDAEEFRAFLCAVLDIESLYEYADPLSSINLHFAKPGHHPDDPGAGPRRPVRICDRPA